MVAVCKVNNPNICVCWQKWQRLCTLLAKQLFVWIFHIECEHWKGSDHSLHPYCADWNNHRRAREVTQGKLLRVSKPFNFEVHQGAHTVVVTAET